MPGRGEIRVVSNSDETMPARARRYGIAVLTSAAAIGAVVLLSRTLPFEPFMLFAAAVAVTSRYGGRGPTVLTIVLSLLAIIVTLFLSTGELNLLHSRVWLHAVVFAIVAMAIDSTSEGFRKARLDAERHSDHLEDVNVELEQQMEEVQVLSEHLQETNQSLAVARDAAEEASRAREEMLAVVAHDLRNPLNVVMMTTRLISENGLPDEKRAELLGITQRAAKRMNRLIEDLLEVVRQESGQMKLDVEEVSVASLIAQTAEMFQAAAVEKSVRFDVRECRPGLIVRGDAERIMQVLSNLVGNALKFVPRGGSVALECQDQGVDAVFSVADSGPGIAREDLDKLFEKFWQRRRSDRRGVGLGLAIARGIVEAHGGRIWAESRVGFGSTFYFTLPVAVSTLGESAFSSRALESSLS
jgi:signal transduction histidine kinase